MSAADLEESAAEPAGEPEFPEFHVRMTLGERLQHALLVVTFLLLVVTGLPLVIYEWRPLQALFSFQSAFYLRGVVHRIAAIGLIGLSVWHAGYVLFTRRGRETVRSLMLGTRDARDAFEILMHNLGTTRWLYRKGILMSFFERHPYWLFRDPPRYGRYNFIEKFEYIAVVWGSLVMIASGFCLWKVELAMQVFPRHVFDVIATIHSYEAILAFLAILVWHMYNVHLAPQVFPMSRVWLTGKISREQLRAEHPLEYEQLEERRRSERECGP